MGLKTLSIYTSNLLQTSSRNEAASNWEIIWDDSCYELLHCNFSLCMCKLSCGFVHFRTHVFKWEAQHVNSSMFSCPLAFDFFFVKSIIAAFLDWQFCQVCFLICGIISRHIACSNTEAMGTDAWMPCCFHELKLAVLEINEKGVVLGCMMVY